MLYLDRRKWNQARNEHSGIRIGKTCLLQEATQDSSQDRSVAFSICLGSPLCQHPTTAHRTLQRGIRSHRNMNNLLDISSPAMKTSDQSLIDQYSQTPFADVPGRILLVFLNRSAAKVNGDRRYVVQVAIAVTNGAKTKQVRTTSLMIRGGSSGC